MITGFPLGRLPSAGDVSPGFFLNRESNARTQRLRRRAGKRRALRPLVRILAHLPTAYNSTVGTARPMTTHVPLGAVPTFRSVPSNPSCPQRSSLRASASRSPRSRPCKPRLENWRIPLPWRCRIQCGASSRYSWPPSPTKPIKALTSSAESAGAAKGYSWESEGYRLL